MNDEEKKMLATLSIGLLINGFARAKSLPFTSVDQSPEAAMEALGDHDIDIKVAIIVRAISK
jgi:hypothetical protein